MNSPYTSQGMRAIPLHYVRLRCVLIPHNRAAQGGLQPESKCCHRLYIICSMCTLFSACTGSHFKRTGSADQVIAGASKRKKRPRRVGFIAGTVCRRQPHLICELVLCNSRGNWYSLSECEVLPCAQLHRTKPNTWRPATRGQPRQIGRCNLAEKLKTRVIF